jgi:hypothetical protein
MTTSEVTPWNRWGPLGIGGPHGIVGGRKAQLPTAGFHGYLRTTLLGSEADVVAPEVGLGEWMGLGLASPPLPGLTLG